ncbi:intercellular trafficking and secretion [Entomophthora muscae]|uniref:Intercellular trafficking and secretion n=1 Tax=Entomophthora muscae TaxID=34485 RepID=A0ACC2RPN3_9FUNG|nr:intercellular trafficking and secretion [Entomophthora muscae]
MDSYDYSNVAWETDSKSITKISPPLLSPQENPYHNGFSDECDSFRDSGGFRSHQNVPSTSKDASKGFDEADKAKTQIVRDPISERLRIVPMEILVSEHQKENENTTDAHISYLVTTKTSLPSFTAPEVSVRRRFQDFVWLFNGLTQEYPASVIPPLPEKHRMEYLTGDRFSEDFIEKRRVSLERFLNRLALHPTLQRSPYMKKFLDSPDWSSSSVRVHGEGLLENLSESIVNAFTKIKRPDPVFVEIKDEIDKFEENLSAIEKMHQRILKRNTEIETEYIELSNAVSSLSLLETGMQDSLSQYSGAISDYALEIKNSNKYEDMYYLSHIREYIAYCQCVKSVLKLREQKQLDVQELTNYLQAQVGELDRIRSTGRAGGLSNFLKDKYEGMKGIDQEQAKQSRLAKCEEKINELEDAVAKSDAECAAFSKEVLKEFEIFQHSKTVDLKDALVTYSRTKVEFFKKSIEIWESVIPKPEGNSAQTPNGQTPSEYPESDGFPQDQNPYAGYY